MLDVNNKRADDTKHTGPGKGGITLMTVEGRNIFVVA